MKSGQRQMSQMLVQHGACVNQANQSQDRAIHVAALHGTLANGNYILRMASSDRTFSPIVGWNYFFDTKITVYFFPSGMI